MKTKLDISEGTRTLLFSWKMCIVEHLTRLGDLFFLLYTWLHPLDIDSRETKLCEGSRVMMMMIHLLPYVVISKTGLLYYYFA